MKTFVCQCGNTLYFENSRCLACKRVVGYLPDDGVISALEPQDNGNWLAQEHLTVRGALLAPLQADQIAFIGSVHAVMGKGARGAGALVRLAFRLGPGRERPDGCQYHRGRYRPPGIRSRRRRGLSPGADRL